MVLGLNRGHRVRLRWLCGLALATIAVACAATVQARAAARGNEWPVVVPIAELTWSAVGPLSQPTVPLWGDDTRQGQGRLERFNAVSSQGPFRAGSETLGIVISGTVTVRTLAPYTSPPLGAGSWFRLPGGATYTVQAQPGGEALVGIIQPDGTAGARAYDRTGTRSEVIQAVVAKAVPFRTVFAGDLAMAVIWGQRQRSASCALVRQPVNTTALMRNYPSDTHLIVVTGQPTVLLEGQKPSKPLGPGSYVAIPAGAPYITQTPKGQGCLMVEYHPGQVDPLVP